MVFVARVDALTDDIISSTRGDRSRAYFVSNGYFVLFCFVFKMVTVR
jgi:hypothetical protein